MGRGPGLSVHEFNRALCEASRLIAPTEQQAGATEGLIVPAAKLCPPALCKTLGGLDPFSETLVIKV